jgi:hypothetical protein
VHGLGEVGLELRRGQGETVEKEDEIDAIFAVKRVAHLSHDPEPVRSVAGEDLLVEGEGGAELGDLERLLQPEHFNNDPEHLESAALVKLIANPTQEGLPGDLTVLLRQGFTRLRLRFLDPGEEVGRIEGAGAVVARRIAIGVKPAAVSRAISWWRLMGDLLSTQT